MIKKVLIVVLLALAANMYGQEGSASPYSFYGIGDLKFRGTVANRSMGGLSIFTDSIHVNLQNPAGYGRLKLTNYAIGGGQRFTDFENETTKDNGSTTTLDYLTLAFPIGKKMGAGFGIMPYTAVGYRVESVFSSTLTNQYTGEGGLNRVFAGFGYSITPDLSVGANLDFNFGKIQNKIIRIQDGLQYSTREINESELTGLSYNIGLNYQRKINEKLQLTTSLTYAPKINLRSLNTRDIATVLIVPNADEVVNDEQNVDLRALGLYDTDFVLPSRLAFGAGLGQSKKWFVGAEYEILGTSKLTNRTFSIDNVRFSNASRFKVGGFYIPKYNSLTSYIKRVVYRAGVRVENTGLEVNNEQINEFGMSFGVGLPVGRLFSNTNIGFEFGQRGTQNSGLIKETFFNINIGLSFNDKWFQKSKIN